MSNGLLTRQEFSRRIRSRISAHLYDDSGTAACGVAIYALADPRDIRQARYIGMTRNPRRRLLQHWNTARLWLPDEKPWWVKSPKLRPLYNWIRDLNRDADRLPVMVVAEWIVNPAEARLAERNRIYACLAQNLPLLNFEQQTLGPQVPLL